MKATHTPGPWKNANATEVTAANNVTVAIAHGPRGVWQEVKDEHFANAVLIGAAPELLDAATIGAEYIRHLIAEGIIKGQHAEMKLSVLDAAIAKAKGE